MNWSSIEQNWKQVRLNVKAKWEKLSDEDLDAINGRRERLEKKIQTRYGFAPEYISEEVDNWLRWQYAKPAEFGASRYALRPYISRHRSDPPFCLVRNGRYLPPFLPLWVSTNTRGF